MTSAYVNIDSKYKAPLVGENVEYNDDYRTEISIISITIMSRSTPIAHHCLLSAIKTTENNFILFQSLYNAQTSRVVFSKCQITQVKELSSLHAI